MANTDKPIKVYAEKNEIERAFAENPGYPVAIDGYDSIVMYVTLQDCYEGLIWDQVEAAYEPEFNAYILKNGRITTIPIEEFIPRFNPWFKRPKNRKVNKNGH